MNLLAKFVIVPPDRWAKWPLHFMAICFTWQQLILAQSLIREIRLASCRPPPSACWPSSAPPHHSWPWWWAGWPGTTALVWAGGPSLPPACLWLLRQHMEHLQSQLEPHYCQQKLALSVQLGKWTTRHIVWFYTSGLRIIRLALPSSSMEKE